jgi:hypothetical protein
MRIKEDFPGMAGSVNNDGCPGVGRFGIPSGPAARTMAREVAEARLRAHGDRLGR